MKKQKFLASFSADSEIGKDMKKVLEYKNQLDTAADYMKTWEQNVAGELIEQFEAHANYLEFKNILSSTVYDKKHGEDKEHGTLLTNICKQLAESLAHYYDYSENSNNAFINWGARFYSLSSEEIKGEIKYVINVYVGNKIKSLDTFLNQFGIGIEFLHLNSNNQKNNTRIDVCVKIFLD